MSEKLNIKGKKLTIRVNIAGRIYALSINRGEEYQEEVIRKAANKINDNIQKYRGNFSTFDTQDLLAISSLELVKELIIEKKASSIDKITEDLKDLNEFIDHLQED